MQKQTFFVGLFAVLLGAVIASSYFGVRLRAAHEAEVAALSREAAARAAHEVYLAQERESRPKEKPEGSPTDPGMNVNQAFRLASLAAHHSHGQLIRLLDLSAEQVDLVGVEIQATALLEAERWVKTPTEKRGKILVLEVVALRDARNHKIRAVLTEIQIPKFDEWIKTEPLPPAEK